VCGYWLFYAVVGGIILLMAAGGAGGDLGNETNRKVRSSTKVIGALSGAALGAGILGLLGDRALLVPKLLVYIGFPAALALTLWTWSRLATDLR
jgi:hypothetical protein